MKLLALLLISAPLAAQTIGAGATIGKGVAVGAPFTSTVQQGIVFTPSAQHFSGTLSSAITYPSNTTASIFYNTNGYAPSPADTLYSSALALTSTTTVNALAYIAGSIHQNNDRVTAGWATVFDPVNTTLPTGCPGSKTGGGVAGVITACGFDTTALGNTALHLSFASTATGTSQRQVLWPFNGGNCDDCTEMTQSFDIQPAENNGAVWAYENDMQLWDATRRRELTAGFQCAIAGGKNVWEISGQSGWTSSGVSTACPPPAGQWTHVEAHAHRIIDNLACSWTGKTTQAIATTAQTAFTVTQTITPGMVLTLGTEQMLATAFTASTSTVTVTRAYNGTTAATYANSTAWAAPTECVYYDWISINGVKTAMNKTFVSHPLPQGWGGGCSSQHQIDTTQSGTVGAYIKNKNMTCGYGTQDTGSVIYTTP